MSQREEKRVLILNPPETEAARQDIPVFFGVSDRSAGAKGLSLNPRLHPAGPAAQGVQPRVTLPALSVT